jgi:hypothetical protein
VDGALGTDGGEPDGMALAVQAPNREAVDRLLAEPSLQLQDHDRVEIHDGEFGGRR